MSTELNEDALLQGAAEAGFAVTADQLKRWRRAGLVQRPRQEHLAGHHGSVSWYPRDALPQVIEVASAHVRTHRLGDLLIDLWWRRCWVEHASLRRELARRLDQTTSGPRKVLARHDDPLSAADELVEQATLTNLSPLLSLMVRRLPGGKRDLREVLWLWAALAGGADYEAAEPDEDDDAPSLEQLLQSAAGIDRARKDRPFGAEPWMDDGPTAHQMMRELRDAGAFDIRNFTRPIAAASDAELDRARDDARLFAEDLPVIGRGLQHVLGQDEAGTASFSTVAASNADDRAGLVRTTLLLRRYFGDVVFDAVHEVVAENLDQYVEMNAWFESLPETERRRARDDLVQRVVDATTAAERQ